MCFFTSARAATYYFSSTLGDDSRTSLQAQSPGTPWKSLAKLNSFIPNLNPGDVILFYRGDVFEGSINITKSGTSTQPILFSDYGSGNKPIISGFSTLRNWTSVGNGVWESSCLSCGSSVNSVVIDGSLKAMGRYPNSDAANGGYLSISSHVGNTSISSTQLSSTLNWSGAELVTRTNRWILDRNKITSHSGSTLTYTAASPQYTVMDNYGFFIQNHPGTLDTYGEWYYNPGTKKIRVFFGSTTPSTVTVQVSSTEDLITTSHASYITFNNLIFSGANTNAFKIYGGQHFQINNSEIHYSGYNGVNASTTNAIKITNTTITFSNNVAVHLNPGVSDAIVKGNNIQHTATMAGMGGSGDLKYTGIVINGANNLVENNRIINTGYNAISFMAGSNNHIKQNYIDTFCTVKDDGSAIGTWNNTTNAPTYTGQKIINNIITNGIGAPQGVESPEYFKSAFGIYLDDNSSNVEVSGNTVTKCWGAGLIVHNAYNLDIKNNTFFNNDDAQVRFLKDEACATNIRNVNLTSNIFFAKTYDQPVAHFQTKWDDISLFGTFDYNYYSRPLDDTYVAFAQYAPAGKRVWQAYDLAGWKQAFDKDYASKKSPIQFKPYQVNTLVGANKVNNGNYNSSTAGTYPWSQSGNLVASWNSGGKLDGGAFQASYTNVVSTSNTSHLVIPIGAVSDKKHYLVKFSLLGSTNNGMVTALLRQAGAPYLNLSKPKYLPLSTSRSQQEFLVSYPTSESNASLLIELRDQDGTMWLDNVEVHEVDVTLTNPDDLILFEYNATNSPKVIKLTQAYLAVNGSTHTGSVELAPYSSIILLKADATASTPVNKAPVANAGTSQTVTADSNGQAQVVLDGSGSSDADGTITNYSWTKGTETIATGAKATVSLPTGEHQITLTVTDDKGATSSAVVSITIKVAASLSAPTNLTASDMSTSQVNLQWQEANADEEGIILERSTTSSFTASLTSTTLPANTTSYQDAGLSEGTTYYYRVKAKKGSLESAYSNLASTTTNKKPAVNAGADKALTLPENTVSLTATASDPDGQIAGWKWTKVSGPYATLSGANTATLSATSLLEGTYVFQVEVNDNKGASATDQVTVKVNAANLTTYYRDADGDGYGTSSDTKDASTLPAGYVARAGDCNDSDAKINPGATEICGNGIDDNCNGHVDENCTQNQEPNKSSKPVITISDITVSEKDGVAMATVELSHLSTEDVFVDYSTLNGTASHPKDFRKASGTVTVPAGILTALINIPIIIDAEVEPAEHFNILLANPVNATIGVGSCKVTIARQVLAGSTDAEDNSAESAASTKHLSVLVSPNPSFGFFKVQTQSKSNQSVVIRVTDLAGYLIEEIKGVTASGSREIGHYYRRGTYIIEIIQGNKRVQIKVLKS